MVLWSATTVKLIFIPLRESTNEELSKDESNLVISDQFPKVILGLLIVPDSCCP